MLSRLIEGIVHLVEDDDDYATASEGGNESPRGATADPRADSGHLTAGTSTPTGSRRPSSRGGSGTAPGSPQARALQQQPSLSQRVLAAARSSGSGGGGGAQQQQQQRQQDEQQQQRQLDVAGEGSQDAAAAGGEGEEEEEEEAERPRRLASLLGGMLTRVGDFLSPKPTSDDEYEEGDGEEAEAEDHSPTRQQQPTSPGGSRLYPSTLADAGAAPQADDADLQGTTTDPAPLAAPQGAPLPQLSEPSGLMQEEQLRALAAAVPPRYRQARWGLLYATARDGISLATLLRNAARRAPTLLVVRDFDRHVFGAYCSEPWQLGKRFFGTGETFVFRLSPRPALWYWWWRRMAKEPNDYFQWGSPEAIAVGGAGGYALWLDADLAAGISRNSATFGNESLAGQEEFRVGAVELWGLS